MSNKNPSWPLVEKYLQSQIEELREKNDNINLNEEETVKIRAKIYVLKDLLQLPETLDRLAAGAEMS